MIAWLVLLLVAIQRLGELVFAERNTRVLRACGAVEVGAGHYPLIITLHLTWLIAIAASLPPGPHANLWLLGVFALLETARAWTLTSLGPFWTTRIITLPGAPLVRRGPYRFVRHPNYFVVIGEIAVLPLAFGQVAVALIFSLLNAAMLGWRIRLEEAALADRRAP